MRHYLQPADGALETVTRGVEIPDSATFSIRVDRGRGADQHEMARVVRSMSGAEHRQLVVTQGSAEVVAP
jgi:hypothetical protein